MSVILAENGYGKSRIRLVRVTRDGDTHRLADYTVAVRLEGEFAAVHTGGDNAGVLPTDTMKNTVFAFAKRHPVEPPEAFADALVSHFLGASERAWSARVEIAAQGWARIGGDHPHAFVRAGEERRLAVVTGSRHARTLEAGIAGLQVLKTTRSAFAGYLHDEYTTLKETEERIFATTVDARWVYSVGEGDWEGWFHAVRGALLASFAEHDSKSVQHTLYAMGEAALAAVPQVEEIRLSLPNRHHLLVDLSPFGLENPNEVFVATEEPHGLIEATLRRDD